MEPITINIIPFLNAQGFVKILDIGVFTIMVLYVIYAFIMIRQIDLMNRSFHTPLAGYFKLLGILHFLASVLIAFLGFFVLV
jgi:hypothetical protein